MMSDRDYERYGARMEIWTAKRATILLAIRKIYRHVGRILICVSIPSWLLRWRWWNRNGDRVDSLREDLFQLEDRRPLPPETRLPPRETRVEGVPLYPAWHEERDQTLRLPPREGQDEPGLQGRSAFAEVQDEETLQLPRPDEKPCKLHKEGQ
jgi:hypothetical protein